MKGSLWLAWRQQRVSAGIGALVLVLAVVIAAYSRSGMQDALHSGLFDHCAPGPLHCSRSATGMPLTLDIEPLQYLGALNIVLPVIIGVFWGAPLLGRDRELGTHRLVLVQGASRGQWFASRFALAAATTIALSGLLAGVFAWWWQPAADRSYGLFWYETTALSGSGPRVVAAALFGLAAGTLLGLLARRVLAAMGLTLLATGAMSLLLLWMHWARLLVPPHTYVSRHRPQTADGREVVDRHLRPDHRLRPPRRRHELRLPVGRPAQGVHDGARVRGPLLQGQPGR